MLHQGGVKIALFGFPKRARLPELVVAPESYPDYPGHWGREMPYHAAATPTTLSLVFPENRVLPAKGKKSLRRKRTYAINRSAHSAYVWGWFAGKEVDAEVMEALLGRAQQEPVARLLLASYLHRSGLTPQWATRLCGSIFPEGWGDEIRRGRWPDLITEHELVVRLPLEVEKPRLTTATTLRDL